MLHPGWREYGGTKPAGEYLVSWVAGLLLILSFKLLTALPSKHPKHEKRTDPSKKLTFLAPRGALKFFLALGRWQGAATHAPDFAFLLPAAPALKIDTFLRDFN